jgi:phage-related protein
VRGEGDAVPRTQVVFFRDTDGTVPLLVWLDTLPTKAQDKCRVKIERLKALGHELRRPEADYLRDGIYELRTKHGGVNYRMLYFFHRNVAAVVSHGLVKEQAVPPVEIDRAIKRKREFEKSPDRHTYREESHAD